MGDGIGRKNPYWRGYGNKRLLGLQGGLILQLGEAEKKPPRSGLICLLIVLIVAVAGCASVPSVPSASSSKVHPGLPQEKSVIRTVGLLPPTIAMFEMRYGAGWIPHYDWSYDAADTVRKAFSDEMAAINMPFRIIDDEDGEVDDFLDLFSAVDFSIRRHLYADFKEIFPEEACFSDYSLGSAREMMERHQVDAVWIVTGFNLLSSKGAWVGDLANIFIVAAILFGEGQPVVGFFPWAREWAELRAALVDKNGTILFYSRLNEDNVPESDQEPYQCDVAQSENAGLASEEDYFKKGFRDPSFARRYIRALLAEYQRKTAP